MKVVLKTINGKAIFLFLLFSLLGVSSVFAAVASCSGVTSSAPRYGTINGVCWYYHCMGSTMRTLNQAADSYCADGDSTTSCTPGNEEFKYTASGCSYTTQTRTCCSNGSWSGWNESCKCSSSSKPSERETCPSGCGTRTRQVSCNYSTGQWQYDAWNESACSAPTQRQATMQNCTNGKQYRSCTATCGGGSCGSWGACQCNATYMNENGVCRKVNCRWELIGGGNCPFVNCAGYTDCSRLSTCTTYKYKDGITETCHLAGTQSATRTYKCVC